MEKWKFILLEIAGWLLPLLLPAIFVNTDESFAISAIAGTIISILISLFIEMQTHKHKISCRVMIIYAVIIGIFGAFCW